MRTRTLLAAVTTAAIAAMVTPSLSTAQDTTAKKTTVSKGEVAMQPSFGSLISALNSSTANADKLKSLTTVNAADVQFVNVEDLLKGNDVSALNNALSKNKEGVDALRSALGSNPAIGLLMAPDSAATSTTSTMSASAKPSAKDVIAADVSADNKLVVYYWKKPSSQ